MTKKKPLIVRVFINQFRFFFVLIWFVNSIKNKTSLNPYVWKTVSPSDKLSAQHKLIAAQIKNRNINNVLKDRKNFLLYARRSISQIPNANNVTPLLRSDWISAGIKLVGRNTIKIVKYKASTGFRNHATKATHETNPANTITGEYVVEITRMEAPKIDENIIIDNINKICRELIKLWLEFLIIFLLPEFYIKIIFGMNDTVFFLFN